MAAMNTPRIFPFAEATINMLLQLVYPHLPPSIAAAIYGAAGNSLSGVEEAESPFSYHASTAICNRDAADPTGGRRYRKHALVAQNRCVHLCVRDHASKAAKYRRTPKPGGPFRFTVHRSRFTRPEKAAPQPAQSLSIAFNSSSANCKFSSARTFSCI
jgi:hypothetical protein